MHPQQILLHSPHALRIEFETDTSRLDLWWSPLAGKSFDAFDRNYANRDDPLTLFSSIHLPGCNRDNFLRCDYDPYDTKLFFQNQTIRILVLTECAGVALEFKKDQIVEFKTGRHDKAMTTKDRVITLSHADPNYDIEYSALLGLGSGYFRLTSRSAPGRSRFFAAEMAAGQCLLLGAGITGDGSLQVLKGLSDKTIEEIANFARERVGEETKNGRITSAAFPELESLQDTVIRGLHSMIDLSGAFRASLKAIYYLIWIRDAAFAFHYQAAAGWPHRLRELSRLLLENPTTVIDADLPGGRMFGQLIDKLYGKSEEDGAFYVIWTLFNSLTQMDGNQRLSEHDHALLTEAIAWVETRCFDSQKGLFGGHFADETPAWNSYDFGWDYAIGKPVGDEHIRVNGQKIVRSYDLYLNTLMHSAYRMMAALSDEAKARWMDEKATNLWERLKEFYLDETDGMPAYGDLLTVEGELIRVRHWGPASSVYVWALSLPNFLPLPDRDRRVMTLLRKLADEPKMHWINGICSAIAAVDPWVSGEALGLDLLLRVKDETIKAGKFLPMGGAMPEKFDAPEGNLYHDIRPQGFAMGAWLGALASLGVRRLPYGLAVRPTAAFEQLNDYAWRGKLLSFSFAKTEGVPVLELNGEAVFGTLQLPEKLLREGENHIRLYQGSNSGPLWIRSSVELESVSVSEEKERIWNFKAMGCSEIVIDGELFQPTLKTEEKVLDFEIFREGSLTILRFNHRGGASLSTSIFI